MQPTITISTFYCFKPLASPDALRAPLKQCMEALNIRGTITLAPEGINATVSGEDAAIQKLLSHLNTLVGLPLAIDRKSYFSTQPFLRTKVKVKPELISLGQPAHPSVCVGEYVPPQQWNALITAPDVITIDTRNDYEYALGHFVGAINPATRDFKGMVQFTETYLSPAKGQRIAMYCTGGIRCDKYSSYLVAQGFAAVYHLKGGILAYLEQISPAHSLWVGDCFVFDDRCGVGHGLAPMQASAA